MEIQKIDSARKIIDSMDYFEKKEIYNRYFSIGSLNGVTNVNEKMILLSLISFTYLKMLEKDPKVTPLDILMKITNQRKDASAFYQTLEGLAIVVEDICYQCDKADSCGLKNSTDIINKIKEILNTWSPF